MRKSVVSKASPTLVFLLVLPAGLAISQQHGEHPQQLPKCPTAQACVCPPERICPEPGGQCDDLPELISRCRPAGVAKLCDGTNGSVRYDVNGDGRITDIDKTLLSDHVARYGPAPVTSSNFWFDANDDRSVDSSDVQVLSEILGIHCPEPIATPTPTPIPAPACQHFAVNFSHAFTQGATKVSVDQSRAQQLNCFEGIMNLALSSASQLGAAGWGQYQKSTPFTRAGGGQEHVRGGILTSQIWEQLKAHNGLASATSFSATDVNRLRADNETAKRAIDCTGSYRGIIPSFAGKGGVVYRHGMWQLGGAFSGAWSPVSDGCTQGTLYLDNNCKFVDYSRVNRNNLCGDISYHAEISTPLSLVWDENVSATSTLVNFKLNPFSDNDIWVWRGSDALPLLVYDPSHKGEITSAIQLFGNWTFGGKGPPSQTLSDPRREQWRDGYEALASLDSDQDGRVDGAELRDLALWFDHNRDGISQAGEVKSLSEVQVTKLFYQATTKDKGGIFAAQGYERTIEGKVQIKPSLDWLDRSLETSFDTFLVKSAHAAQKGQLVEPQHTETENVTHASVQAKLDLSGVWSVTLDMPAKGSGVLTFETTDEGTSGSSVIQLGIRGLDGVASRILFASFPVSIKDNQQGGHELEFSHKTDDGSVIANYAIISEDRSTLRGKTTVSRSSLSETGEYQYSWKAVRIAAK